MLSTSVAVRTSLSKQGRHFKVLLQCSRYHSTVRRLYPVNVLKGLSTWRDPSHNTRHAHTIASNSIHPIVLSLTTSLANKQPAFNVAAETVTVLHDPAEFYQLLLAMINRAKKRIFISSLYIGSKEEELISALHTALASNPNLQLYLTLDFNRATRPGSSPSSSTAHLLLPLLQEFPDRVHVSMFRSPHLRGLLAKVVPPRFNEGWGTWHAKVYGADGEVMISGANLNKSYFTNRQDRYIHFASQPSLAQYCFDFLQAVAGFSYQLLPLSPPASTTPESNEYIIHRDGYTLHWPDPSTHPHYIQRKAEKALAGFQASQKATHSVQVQLETPTTTPKQVQAHKSVLLFPIIQAGQFNIREEESAFHSIFRSFSSASSSRRSSSASAPTTRELHHQRQRPLVDLTSGYFSHFAPYQSHVLSSEADTRIVVAAPEANGFFGSKGMSGRIPEGYVLKERRFVRSVKAVGRWWGQEETREGGGTSTSTSTRRGRVKLEEWRKDGWTYHAKGIWVSPQEGEVLPVATLFGSTNLNARSAHIDTELSFIMVLPVPAGSGSTPNSPMSSVEKLRRTLGKEVKRIREHASEWKGDKREVRFLTKIIAWLVNGML